jgi:hypothetical protein
MQNVRDMCRYGWWMTSAADQHHPATRRPAASPLSLAAHHLFAPQPGRGPVSARHLTHLLLPPDRHEPQIRHPVQGCLAPCWSATDFTFSITAGARTRCVLLPADAASRSGNALCQVPSGAWFVKLSAVAASTAGLSLWRALLAWEQVGHRMIRPGGSTATGMPRQPFL